MKEKQKRKVSGKESDEWRTIRETRRRRMKLLIFD